MNSSNLFLNFSRTWLIKSDKPIAQKTYLWNILILLFIISPSLVYFVSDCFLIVFLTYSSPETLPGSLESSARTIFIALNVLRTIFCLAYLIKSSTVPSPSSKMASNLHLFNFITSILSTIYSAISIIFTLDLFCPLYENYNNDESTIRYVEWYYLCVFMAYVLYASSLDSLEAIYDKGAAEDAVSPNFCEVLVFFEVGGWSIYIL